MVSFRQAEQASMNALNKRREDTRKESFKGREDVSPNRLDRRQIQSDLYEKFKQEQMKPVLTTSGKPTGAFQSIVPGGPTLANEAMRLANMYGPTPKEIMGDIGYGLGNIARGFGDFMGRGGALGNILSGIYDKFKSGTQKGIESVGSLYDNLRQIFSGKPTVTRGGGSSYSTVTEEPYYSNVANRGMNIPVSIAQPVASTPLNTGFIPEGYGGITSIPLSSGYLPEGYSYGIGSVPDYYDSNNTLGNIYLNSQGYDVPVSNDLMSSRTPSYLEQQDNYYYQNRPQSSPTGQQYYYADASKKDIKTIAPFRDAGMSYGDVMNNFGSVIDNLRQKNPSLTDDDIKGILEGTITQPTGIFAKNGGSVDKYAGLGYKLR